MIFGVKALTFQSEMTTIFWCICLLVVLPHLALGGKGTPDATGGGAVPMDMVSSDEDGEPVFGTTASVVTTSGVNQVHRQAH